MKFRITLILIFIGLSVFQLFFKHTEGKKLGPMNVRLGLDLQGGIFMQLEVDSEDAFHQFLEEQAGSIKTYLTSDDFKLESATAENDRGSVLLTQVVAPEGKDAMEEIGNRYSDWNLAAVDNGLRMTPREQLKRRVIDDAIEQTVYKIQNRIDELGVTEPIITRALNSNRIILELAGADDVKRVHKIVQEPGKLEWRLVHPGSNPSAVSQDDLLAPFGGAVPTGTKVFPNIGMPGATRYTLLEEVLLTATNIVNVSPSQDDRGMPAVGITLDREGQNIFSRKTAENVGEILAITLDGKVISAPRIETAINQPRFIIQGQFTQKQVSDMVVKIKSGSLPARVRILEERVIGPTLGRDAIAEGVRASAIGLAFVGLFMIYWFRRAGVYSVIALTLNMLFMAGMLSGMDAVLTLPGIAGFILTIGMAVDANVLVYERIKEEVNRGVTLTNAITRGFDSAYVTILDANITTFIAAFCLLLMGEGPVKGFAVMLMIGIISSIFTAVYCTRTFFMAVDLPNHSLSIFPLHRNQGAQRSHS